MFGGRAITEHSEEYKRYLRSDRWKKFRKEIIAYRAHRCQDCGGLGTEYTLQVHHLNYDCLGKEKPTDVLVLCPSCHAKADRERAAEADHRRTKRFNDARLDGWATKVYGEDWEFTVGHREAWNAFVDWLERRGE